MVGAKGKARETYIRRARNIWSKNKEAGGSASSSPAFKVLNGNAQTKRRPPRSQSRRKLRKRRASTGSTPAVGAVAGREDGVGEGQGEEEGEGEGNGEGEKRSERDRGGSNRVVVGVEEPPRQLYRRRGQQQRRRKQSRRRDHEDQSQGQQFEGKRGDGRPPPGEGRDRRPAPLRMDAPPLGSRSPKGSSPRAHRYTNSDRVALARAVLGQLARSGMSAPETIAARAFGSFSSRPLGAPRSGKRAGVQRPSASIDLSLSSTSPRVASRVVQGSPIHAVRGRREQAKLS